MPNGDNWQGDVLRDLRGGAQPAAPGPGGQQQPMTGPGAGAPGAGGQVPAGAAPDPAYGYPHQDPAAATAGPAHAAPQGHRPPQPRQQAPYASGGSAQAPRTPESRPAVDRSLAGVGRGARRGEPFAARAVRAVRRTVSSSASREVAEATRAAELLQQPVTTGRQIAVTSIRGGAGEVHGRRAARHHVRALQAGPRPLRRGRPRPRLAADPARRRDPALDHR